MVVSQRVTEVPETDAATPRAVFPLTWQACASRLAPLWIPMPNPSSPFSVG